MAADGTVVIDIKADGGNEAIDTMDKLKGAMKGLVAPGTNAGKVFGGLKEKLSLGAVMGLAQQGISTLTGGLGGLISGAAEASDSMDKFKSTMQFAGFTKKETDQASKAMKTYADQTVYNLGDVMNTTAQLAANGIPNYQKLTKAAGNLNAVAGGNADTFKSVAMVLTQTAGAGKLTTENWNQLTDAIPGASGKLQEAMKKNGAYTGNFRDAMEKGQISAGEFNKAIEQLGMTDAAKKAAASTETFEGALGNLQANFQNAFLAIFNAIGKANITNLIGGIINTITKATPFIQSGITAISDSIGMLVAFISGNFKSFDKFHDSLVKLVGKDTAGKIVPVLAAIGGAVHDFIDVVKATGGVLSGNIGSFKEFSSAISTTVPPGVVDVMYGIAKAIKAVVDAAIANPKAVTTIIGALVGVKVLAPVAGVLAKVGSGFAAVGKTAGGIIGKLTGFGKAASDTAGGAKTAGSAFGGMGSDMLKAGVGIGVAAAGFGVLVFGISSLAKTGTAGMIALAGVTVAIAALAGVFALLGPTLTANAIGIGVFGAAVAGIGIGIGAAAAGIALLLNAITSLGQNMTLIIPTMTAVGAGFATMIAGFVATLAANAPVIAAGVLVIITTMLTTLTTAIPLFVNSGLQLLLGILTGINNNIGQITTTVLSIIANFLTAVAQNLGSVITAGVSVLVALIEGIADNLGRIIDAAVDLIGAFLLGLAKAIPRIADKALAVVEAFVEGIGYALGKVLTSGSDLIAHFATGIMKGMGQSNKASRAVGKGVKGVFEKLNLFNIGANIIKGLASGIGSMAGAVWDKVKDIGNGISKGMKKLLGIHSPSKVMRDQVGKFIPLGLAEGMQSQLSAVSAASLAMSQAATPNISTGAINGSINSANRQLRQGLNSGLQKSFVAVKNTVGSMAGQLSDAAMVNATVGLSSAVQPEALAGSRYTAIPNNQVINNYSTTTNVGETQPRVIEVHVSANIDKRELAREIADPVKIEIDRMQRTSNRIRGVR
ncbi:MAG: tape measure protein [Lactobacillus sp.]|nr:tape measure protein [Lactobacillus sp.]